MRTIAFLIAGASAVGPIQKVVELLTKIGDQLTAEGKDESQQFDDFTKWCQKTDDELTDNIRTNEDNKAAAQAGIEKFAGEIVEHNTEVEKLGGAIAQAESDVSQARSIRADENKDFVATEKELQEAVDAIVRAMSIIRRGGGKKTPGAFAQIAQGLSAIVDASFIEDEDRSQLKAFMQAQTDSEEEDGMTGAPAGAAYSNHSNGIMDLLNSMKKKAEGELQDAQTAEMNRRQNFELLEQSLTDQLKVDKRNMDENKQLSGQKGESKGQAEGDLADANKQLSNDNAALSDTTNHCKQTSANYEARVKARQEEQGVIADAIGILSGDDFKTATGESFLQSGDNEDVREQVSNILQSASDKYNSAAFAQLASRTRVGDPFGKVKGLIEDMITKLQKQAVEEANKKAYCDTEKKKGEAERAKLSQRSDLLQTRDDKYSADMAKTKSDIATLAQELSDIADSVAEATNLRAAAAKSFAKFKADSELRIKTIANAIQTLSDYYSKSSLIQTASKTNDIGDAYVSKTGGSSGIIGLLETAQADVEKELSQASANEESEKRMFKKFHNESESQTSSKNASKEGKEGELKRLSASREETRQDHESTGKELDAAVEGLSKLREACVHQPMSFEERAQKRADEISSLKEALELLTPETSLIQKSISTHRA